MATHEKHGKKKPKEPKGGHMMPKEHEAMHGKAGGKKAEKKK